MSRVGETGVGEMAEGETGPNLLVKVNSNWSHYHIFTGSQSVMKVFLFFGIGHLLSMKTNDS